MEGARLDCNNADPCKHRRVITYFLPRLAPWLPYQGAHQGCAQNEAWGLANRHITRTPAKSEVGWIMASLCEWLRGHRRGVRAYTPSQVLARRSGRLRRRYAAAFQSLTVWPLCPRDARVTAFVKFEKADLGSLSSKPPRLIQHRSPRYCAAISRFLMPIEKLVFALDHRGATCGVEGRVFAKGLNSWQRARRILAMKRWADTAWVLIDHSRFDSQLSREFIAAECDVYRFLLPDQEMSDLLRSQLRNTGRTRGGVRYTVTGTKMSGEYNTALGDSLCNYALLRTWTRDVDAELFVDGDDSVVAVSAEQLNLLDPAWFVQHGWNTKVEVVRGELERVEFCQSRPVWFPDGWRMTRNPTRLLSRGQCTVKNFRGDGWLRYIRACADCEAVCGVGTPVHQAYAQYLLKHAQGRSACKDAPDDSYKAQFEPRFVGWQEIHPETRASYHAAWGLTPSGQVALEREILARDDRQHTARLISADGPYERDAVLRCLVQPGSMLLLPPC